MPLTHGNGVKNGAGLAAHLMPACMTAPDRRTIVGWHCCYIFCEAGRCIGWIACCFQGDVAMAPVPSTESVAAGWKAVGGFFRVFDIAFFLPGGIFLLGLSIFRPSWVMDVEKSMEREGQSLTSIVKLDIPELPLAILIAVAIVALVFFAGLLCHAVARMFRSGVVRLGAWQWKNEECERWWRHPYLLAVRFLFGLNEKKFNQWGSRLYGPPSKKDISGDREMMLYFWNMATLCWNLAAALGLVAFIVMLPLRWPLAVEDGRGFIPLGMALVVAMLGSEFRYFWEKEKREEPGTPFQESQPL